MGSEPDRVDSLNDRVTVLTGRLDQLDEKIDKVDNSNEVHISKMESDIMVLEDRVLELLRNVTENFSETSSKIEEHLEDHRHVEHAMDETIREATTHPPVPALFSGGLLERRLEVLEEGLKVLTRLLEVQLPRDTREHLRDVSTALEGVAFP